MEVGTHIQKKKNFNTSLHTFYDQEENKNKPCQLFTGSPKFWRRSKLDDNDVINTQQYIKDNFEMAKTPYLMKE